MGDKNDLPSTESIRTEGQWVIHLLVRHNYLFLFPLIYFFVHLGHGCPRKPKESRFFLGGGWIIQIKH